MPADEVVGKVLKELFSAENRGKLHLYLIYESITNNEMLKKRLISAYDQWLVMIKEGLSVLMNDTEKVTEYAELLLIMITGGIVHSTLGFGPQRIDGIMSLIFSGNPA